MTISTCDDSLDVLIIPLLNEFPEHSENETENHDDHIIRDIHMQLRRKEHSGFLYTCCKHSKNNSQYRRPYERKMSKACISGCQCYSRHDKR